MALGLSFVGACETATAPEEELQLTPPTIQMPTTTLPLGDLPAQAIIDRTLDATLPGYLEANADEIAEHGVIVLQLRMLLSDVGPGIAAALRERNPNLVILADWPVLTIPDHWNDPSHRERFPLSAEVYDIFSPRLARTTTGDVPLMWEEGPMINPMRNGKLDEALQERLLAAIVRWYEQYPGTFHGFFHDYMSPRPWIYPSPEEANIGDVDLDGDGVGVREDAGDAAVWVAWQARLLDRLQTIFGPGLIQIANGKLPLDDPQVAQRLAGIWYQHFPTTVWGLTDLQGLEMAMDHHDGDYLTPRRGRTWSIFSAEAVGRDGNIDFRRHASFLTDQYYVYSKSRSGDFAGRDPLRLELGPALGSPARVVGGTGEIIYSRAFRDGTVRIVFEPWGQTRALEIDANEP